MNNDQSKKQDPTGAPVHPRVADDLIYLLACAVNSKKPDPDRVKLMDLDKVYRLSQLHDLTCAAAFALKQVMPLPHAFDQAMKKAIRKQALFDIERVKILHALEQHNIWYLPLKGILLKNDYPKTAMREMSDNDILVDPTRMEDVRELMQALGYRCDTFGLYNHDAYSKPPTLEFEMHHALFEDNETLLFVTYYKAVKDRLIQDGCACRMTDEDFYLYILCHTFKHYVHGGIGLRSLLDVYVYLRAHPQLDRSYIDKELHTLKLTDFERKMRILSQKVFTLSALTDAEKEELKYFVSCGYFGDPEIARENQLTWALNNDDSKSAKRHYLKQRVFIAGDALEKHYPFVAKHKALYPLLLLYRPVKGALTHPSAILSEYQRVRRFRKKKNDNNQG